MCNKMSDVRLSNASPTLERVDARQQDNFRPSVRRNLFGTYDREEIRRYVAASLQEDVQDFRERYNFDPVSGTPLTTRNYEWQEDSDAPEFYHRPPHGSQRPQREVDSPDGNSRRDAEERSAGRSDRQTDRNGSRKRRSASGPCSDECQSKILHTDEDDDEDQSDGAGSQAVTAAQRRPSRPEESAEVQ